MMGRYPVVTLCGSTRFKDDFIAAQKQLTLDGKIVISVGLFGHAGDREVWEGMSEGEVTAAKLMLDDMHKRKIDMSDSIYVINRDGYIGESTASEIAYAAKNGKEIAYMEEIESLRCPICGKYYFPMRRSYEICPVCGWEDDPVQRGDEEYTGGANHMSVLEARAAYAAGKEVR